MNLLVRTSLARHVADSVIGSEPRRAGGKPEMRSSSKIDGREQVKTGKKVIHKPWADMAVRHIDLRFERNQ